MIVAVAVAAMVVMASACGPKPPVVEEPREPRSGTGTGTGSGAAGDGAKDPLATAVERIVTLYEEIGRLPPAGSCAEAAATIDRWTAERGDAIVQVRDAAQGEQAALVDGLFHDASPRLAAAMKGIDELAARCASEPSVTAALARLSPGTERQP